MTDPAAIPSVDDVIGKGIDAAVAVRPTILPHVDTGKWANVITGLRAQEAVLIGRIADEVKSSRLATASGEALRELAASEFDVLIDPSPTYAYGFAYFRNLSGTFTGGTIKKGTRFRRAANVSVSPQVKDATYEVVQDQYVPNGSNVLTILLRATQPGSFANLVTDDGTAVGAPATSYSFVDPVYDPNIISSLSSASFGGGSDAPTDDDIRRMARLSAQGRYGPTSRALLAGAFSSGLGVRYALAVEDTVNAKTVLIIADSSRSGASGQFASAAYWPLVVQQSLLDGWCGFGCRVDVRAAITNWVSVQPTIVLRDSSYQNNTTDISNNVTAALSNYFGNRPDFNVFKSSALRGVIARADRRILTCTSVTVTTPSGTPLADPIAPAPGSYSTAFYMLASNGLNPTYVNPS